jgi:hypothetical protein
MGGTQYVNGAVAPWPTEYWMDAQEYQGSSTNGYWTDPNAGNLLARWDMELRNSTSVKDTGTNAYNADILPDLTGPQRVIVGTNVNGRVEHAYYFNGVNGKYLKTSATVSVSTQWTISAWCFITNPASITEPMRLISNEDVSWVIIYVERVVPRRYISYVYGVFSNTPQQPVIPTNQWGHICIVESGSKLETYFNGVTYGTTANTASAKTSKIYIGARSGESGSVWNNKIDDVRIYNYAMTSNSVLALYQNTHPTNNLEARASQTKYTIGNGSTAGFGPIKLWTQHGDPTNEWWNYKSGATSWGL